MMTLGEFRFQVATTPAMMEAIHRLRYKVYVEEYGFEKPEDHPDGMETDQYDPHSIHLAALDSHGRVVGTIRGILNNPLGLPAMDLLEPSFKDKNPSSLKIAEVSRLALDASLRGNVQDNFGDFEFYLTRIMGGEGKLSTPSAPLQGWQRRVVVLLGLIQQIYHVGQILNITDFYMVAEKRLGILLRRHHINWHPIGPEIEYHGKRVVFMGHDWEIGPAVLSFNQKITKAMGLDKPKPGANPTAQLGEVEGFYLGGFRFAVASREEEVEEVIRLRNEVDEAMTETESALFGRQAENFRAKDAYDPYSIHIVAWDSKHRLAGALRLTLNSNKGLFSLKKAFPQYPERHTVSKKIGEISRLVFAQPYRGAFRDILAAFRAAPLGGPAGQEKISHGDRRRAFLILLGLMRMTYRVSKRLRLTKWYLMMDVSVAEFLARRGFYSHCIGPTQAGILHTAPHVMNFHETEPAMLDFRAIRSVGRDLVMHPAAGFIIDVDSPYFGATSW